MKDLTPVLLNDPGSVVIERPDPGSVVNSTASAMDRAWQAVQMQQNILLAARNSLKDGNALAQLNVFHPIRTFNELKADLGKKFSGQKLYEKIVEAAEANCKRESIGCFVAGTLVHTKDGLKPIQDIQVGDYVLSRPESGEEGVAYKRVVNTFRFENKPVSYVEYVTFQSKNDVVEHSGADYLIATPNHPFWVVGKTMIEGNKQVCDYYALPLWKSVDQLDYEEIVVLSNGQQVKITGVGAIKKTKQNGTGWHQAQYSESPLEDDGHLVNFSPENVTAELTFMSRAVFNEDAPRDKFEDYVDYESVVYNLEVEDFHTYFVGKMGVWVHNTNCGGSDASGTQNLTQEVVDAAKNKLSPTKLPGVHASAATFEKALPASKKAIGAFKEQDVLKWWAELQYRFDGSLSIAIDGVRTLYAYGLGFNNPFGGRSVNAMGDALAHIYKDGKRIPSNTLVDTKAGTFGTYSDDIRRYSDSNIYDNLDFADKAKLDARISQIVLKFKRDGAALAQYQGELNLTIAPQVSSDVLERFIKKVALEDKWKTYHNAQFEVNSWRESDWLSENIFFGGLKSANIEGQTRYVLDDQMKRIKKIYDTNGKLVDVQFESVARDSVLKPLQGDNVGQSLLRNIYDWVKQSGLKFQTTQAHGSEDVQTSLSVHDANQILSAAKAYWLQLGARAEILNAASISVVSDLPNSVAATTEGSKIRLSVNGAGWGWFVDETPNTSGEFVHDDVLQNYIATQGSKAEGKLDLLTVLIHELGHVLGAQDLLRQEDVMSGALAPGVRRLPTAGDVASWLDAQRLRPIDSVLSSGFAVRVSNAVSSSANSPVNSSTVVAASSFSGNLTNWAVQGAELITTQQIVLVEKTQAHSRANQVFTLGERDRFLTFTVTGLDLQNNSTADQAAPQDAFEVALLNANTGLPVMWSAGSGSTTASTGIQTTRSDALLNIQRASSRMDAALSERASQGVSHIDNADGSRTYLVNLAGIAANTAVNLSFDLIGFGLTRATQGSKVSIKDVRLLSTPLAVNDKVTVAEDQPLTIHARANDLNVDAPGFSVEIVSLATHGQVTLLPDGTFSYSPAANYFGQDSFTYRYTDGSAAGRSEVATVSINVTPVNDAPVASDVTVTTAEDNSATITLIAADADNTPATLVFTIQNAPQNGALSRNENGTYSYTPAANFFGSDSFTYTVSDGDLVSNVATVRITVASVNDAPILPPARSLSVNEDSQLVIDPLAGATDADSDPLTARIVAAPSHGSLTVNADGTFSYAPAANYFGADSFTYRLNDGSGDGSADSEIATITINVAAVNDAPVASDVTVTTQEDNAVTINLIALDADNMPANLTFAIQSAPQNGSLTANADGSYSYTPAANFSGSDSFTYNVTDGDLVSNTATVRITVTAVNDAPTLGNQALSVAEDNVLNGNLLTTATDVDSTALTARIIAGPVNGRLTVNANGTFSYQGNKDYFGTDSFTYRVSDGALNSEIATVSLTVTAVNDAPVASDVTVSTQEDNAVTINLVALDADNTPANLVFAIQNAPQNGTLTANADGSYSYSPALNFHGADSFTYTVTDGDLVSNVATVRITVASVNDAPVLPPARSLAVNEDSQIVIDPLAGALDADGDTLTARIIAGPANGSLTVNADGTFSYAPAANYFGTDSFTYRVNDGSADSEIATITINVAAVNDAPVASDVTVSTQEDNAVTINLVAADADNTPATLTFTIQNAPQNGTLTANADGTYSYSPALNFNGSDSFTYTVTDGNLVSNVATVRVTVTSVNDAPVLPPSRSIGVNEDSSLVIDPLAGSLDADGDALTARIIAGPANGSLTVNADGTFSYAPAANYFGTDSFTYRVNDGSADSEIATITINVAAVNDAPVASDVTVTTLEDNAVTINLVALDADNTPATLTFTIQNAPQNGTLTANADGSYSYRPALNFNGADSFTYTVSDGDLVSNTATVRVTVTSVNDAPVLPPARGMAVNEDASLVIDPLAGATDADGDTLTARIIAGPMNGTLTLNANGTFSYQGNKDYFGTDSFTYRVNDGTTDSVIATITINVAAVNDAPVASDVTVTTLEDDSVTINLVALDADNTPATLVFATQNAPQNGTLTANADGSYSYTPAANFFGSDSFTYTVTDGDLVSNVATVRISVSSVNDAPVLPPTRNLSAREDSQIVIDPLAGATDADGDTLTASIIAGPANGTVTIKADGTFSYIGAKDYFGTDSFTYRVNDGTADSEIATITINVAAVNDAPVASDVTVSTLEDNSVTINLVALDADNTPATLVFAIQNAPQNGTLTANADGSYNYSPALNFNGADSFTYTVTDGDLVSNTATVRISVTAVNDAPVAQDLVASLLEDGYVILNLASLSSDVDGNPLAITPANPAQGSLTVDGNGSYRYTPAANFSGADSFTYTVSDGQSSASATVRLNVTAINDAPIATGDSASVIQGQSVTLNVLANDIDIDSQTSSLRPVIVSQPARGTVIVNANGTLTYTPTSTYNGADSFTYAVSDGDQQSAPVTVNLTVTPNNRPPVFTSTPPSTITLGAGSGTGGGTGGGTSSGDSVFLPTHSNGNSGNQITTNFKLTERSAGYDNEVGYYRVDDASGRIGNLLPGDAGYAAAALAASRAVNLFEECDDVGDKVSSKIAAGQHIGFYLIQNASLSEWRSKNSANALPTGNQTQQQKPLAFFSFQAANPDGFDHLKASFAGNNGGGLLTLMWEDLTGGGDKDFDDVVFTATGFKAVSTTTTPPAVTSTLFTYDADATDADGDTITYSLSQAPQGAVINAQTGLINWTASTAGTYSFNVTASDGKGGSTTQTFTLTVNNAPLPNRLPVASNDSATLDEDTTVKINVLANDTDADGNTLSANVVTGPQNGTLTKNADGSYSYTPKKDWFGTDSFTYRANDGKGDSNLATVTLTVRPVNDAPVAQNASYTLNRDGSIKIDLRSLTSDVDGDCLTITIGNAGKGTLTRNSDGTCTYRPRSGYTGADSFSYTASDGKLSSTGTISLNVGQGANAGGGCGPSNSSSASIVVNSSATGSSSSSSSNNQIQYVVINSGASSTSSSSSSASTSSSNASVAINWQATSSTSTSSSGNASSTATSNWLAQLLRNTNDDESESLAKSTGLRVKL